MRDKDLLVGIEMKVMELLPILLNLLIKIKIAYKIFFSWCNTWFFDTTRSWFFDMIGKQGKRFKINKIKMSVASQWTPQTIDD